MCNNKIEQVVPTKYSAKVVEGKCGQTGIYGEPIYCNVCINNGTARENERMDKIRLNDDY